MFKSTAVIALAALVIGATNAAAQAQTAPAHRPYWQLVVNSGRVIPTGTQRAAIGQGKVTAAQVSYLVEAGLAVTASAGWTRTRDVASPDNLRLHVFTYDVGAELRGRKWMDGRVLSLRPFGGIGAGGRTYDYRGLEADATHNLSGYVSAGGELGIARRVTLRLEARDYLSGFKPLLGEGSTAARNDLALMAGLRLGVR